MRISCQLKKCKCDFLLRWVGSNSQVECFGFILIHKMEYNSSTSHVHFVWLKYPNPQSEPEPVLCIYCEDKSAGLFRQSSLLLEAIVAKETLEWETIPRTTVDNACRSIGKPWNWIGNHFSKVTAHNDLAEKFMAVGVGTNKTFIIRAAQLALAATFVLRSSVGSELCKYNSDFMSFCERIQNPNVVPGLTNPQYSRFSTTAIAVEHYDAEKDGYLSLARGERILILCHEPSAGDCTDTHSSYLFGKIEEGRHGWFPESKVKELE